MLSSCRKTYYANFSPLSRGGALLIQEHPRRVCQGDAAVHAPPPEGPVGLLLGHAVPRHQPLLGPLHHLALLTAPPGRQEGSGLLAQPKQLLHRGCPRWWTR